MRTIEDFIDNLSNDDIDLINKLENLSEAAQINKTVYKLAHKKDNFESIEYYIKEILQDDIGDSKLAENYIDFITTETESLYEQKLIYEANDFTSGLYNCDDLYLYAIADVLDMDMNELSDESEDD